MAFSWRYSSYEVGSELAGWNPVCDIASGVTMAARE